jgi:uncharacterized protein (DUF1778 family)
MATSRPTKKTQSGKTASSLMVRLDEESKRSLAEAADLRQISISDYVRTVTVAQARREVRAARDKVIALTPEEQLSFWNALNEAPKLTAAQKRLGSAMRGEN